MPFNMPEMGVDFDTLARLAQPRAPVQFHPGGGTMEGLMYGQDVNQMQGFLDKASKMADIQAALKQQAAKEAMMGAPGREAEIQKGNTLSQADLGTVGDDITAMKGKKQNAIGDQEVKAMKNEIGKLSPYLNAWDKADPQQKALLYKQMGDEGASFGKIKIGSLPFNDADNMMKALRNAQINDEKFVIESNKNVTKENVAKTSAAARVDSAKISAQARTIAAKYGVDTRNANPRTFQEAAMRLWQKGSQQGGLTDDENEELNTLLKAATFGTEVRAAAIKPDVTIEGGKIVNKPPVLPPVPTAPESFTKKTPAKVTLSQEDQIKQAVIKSGEAYEPDKFIYRINPQTGRVQKKPK